MSKFHLHVFFFFFFFFFFFVFLYFAHCLVFYLPFSDCKDTFQVSPYHLTCHSWHFNFITVRITNHLLNSLSVHTFRIFSFRTDIKWMWNTKTLNNWPLNNKSRKIGPMNVDAMELLLFICCIVGLSWAPLHDNNHILESSYQSLHYSNVSWRLLAISTSRHQSEPYI